MDDLAAPFYHAPVRFVGAGRLPFFLYSFPGLGAWSASSSGAKRARGRTAAFANSPFCVIYGVGAHAGVNALLRPFSRQLTCCCMWLARRGGHRCSNTLTGAFDAEAVRLASGGIIRNKPFNYKGIICLESTLGLGAYQRAAVCLHAERRRLRVPCGGFRPHARPAWRLPQMLGWRCMGRILPLSMRARAAPQGSTKTVARQRIPAIRSCER